MTLSASAAAEARGRDVVNRTGDACSHRDVELLAALLVLFDEVVKRTPEFHVLMDDLIESERGDDIRRIFRVPGRRGPKPSDQFFAIALIEHVLDKQKRSEAAEAIRTLREAIAKERQKPTKPGDPDVPSLPGEKALGNLHSRLHKLFRFWRDGIHVPGELLTATPWTLPDSDPTPIDLVPTKLSNAIVFHSPDVKVIEPKKEN